MKKGKKIEDDSSLSNEERIAQLSRLGARYRGASLSVGTILSPGMDNMGKGKISLPNDYQYDNAKPGENLEANTIFGMVVELDENLEEKVLARPMPAGLLPLIIRGLRQ